MPISSSAEPAPPGLPRPDPDALVARLRHERAQEGRGKLRIYFGSNAGVGKTYAMLAAAQRERQGGREVLVGLVETHGRKETAQQLHGLEQLPLRELPPMRRQAPRPTCRCASCRTRDGRCASSTWMRRSRGVRACCCSMN